MPHIDNGTLHALLDGALRAMEPREADAAEAHLEACAECRARLEEASALRGRAGEILGVLEPAVTPDFEEVLVRAGASSAAEAPARVGDGRAARGRGFGRQARWTRGVAWAATIVIALGTGYLIRDRLVPQRAASVVERTAPVESLEAERLESREATASEETVAGDAERAGDDPPARPAADDAAAPRSQAPEAAGAEIEVAPAPPPPPPEADAALDARLGQADSPRPGITGAEFSAPLLDSAVTLAEAQTRNALVARGEGVPIRLRGVTSRLAPGDVYEPVAPGDVFDAVGAPLMVLPGAEVVWARVGRRGETERVVVSLQRVETGVEIRVTQQPAKIALEGLVVTAAGAGERRAADEAEARPAAPQARPAEAPAAAARADSVPGLPLGSPFTAGDLPPGHSRVTGPANWLGWELVLEGPLPEEALRALHRGVAPYEMPGGGGR